MSATQTRGARPTSGPGRRSRRDGARWGRRGRLTPKPGGGGGASRHGWSATRIIVVTVVAVLAVALGAAVYAVGFSSAFGVREVQVHGTHRLTAPEVAAAAAVPVGRPLARLDTAAIKRRVAALPQVAAVDVQRDWPHTVVIQVTERTAVAYAVDAQAKVWLVDINGVAFASVASPPSDLAKYVAATPSTPSAGDKAALQVAAGLPNWLVAITQSISASSPDDVRLALSGSRTVVWGGVDQSAAKATALKALLAQQAAAATHGVYDVSSPKFVTVR